MFERKEEYTEELYQMMYFIGKAIDESPYGGTTEIQNEVNEVEELLHKCYDRLSVLKDKLQENEE
jgi:hypothetical protein